jgi:hypothetical protein
VDEIEARLKRAGVEPKRRARIHTAIRRGVVYLPQVQRDDGSIVGNKGPLHRYLVAHTALGGLALAHAGHADARGGARRAVDWLAPLGGRSRMAVTGGGSTRRAHERHPLLGDARMARKKELERRPPPGHRTPHTPAVPRRDRQATTS